MTQFLGAEATRTLNVMHQAQCLVSSVVVGRQPSRKGAEAAEPHCRGGGDGGHGAQPAYAALALGLMRLTCRTVKAVLVKRHS